MWPPRGRALFRLFSPTSIAILGAMNKTRHSARLGLQRVLMLTLLSVLVHGCAPEQAPASEGPRARNLLLITVDTLRTDRLGCYGGPNQPSPVIDALAKRGTRFANAYVPRGLTLPSMTSFFTSKYPAEHGVINNQKLVDDQEWMLAERLTEAGFRCQAFNASSVLGGDRGNIEQGFLDYVLEPDENALTEKARRYLQERFGRDGQREFLWVHFMNPHKPYNPPAEFLEAHDPDYAGKFDGSGPTLGSIYVRKLDLAPPDRRHIELTYDGTISYVDEMIGQLLADLADSPAAADTLVVFSSDHGEDLYSHNHYYFHANSIYRSSTSIPLIFAQDGQVRDGQVVDDLISSLDVMPTVLRWLDVPEANMGNNTFARGEDLTDALLEGKGVHRDFVFAQWENDIFSVRNLNWSYVWNKKNVTPEYPPKNGSYPIAERELYDLREDPDEQHNVLAQHPDIAAKMHERLNLWLEQLRFGYARDDDSEKTRNVLKEWGYFGDDEGEEASLPSELDAASTDDH